MRRRSIAILLLAAGALAAPGQVHAQPQVDTAQVKQWCEAAPDGIVRLPEGARVVQGPARPESVAGGCTIIVARERTLELNAARLRFAGALEVRGGDKTKVELKDRSELEAPETGVSLAGQGTELKLDDSGLRTGEGSLTVTLGAESRLDLQYGVAEGRGLVAGGEVRIAGGRKLQADLKEGLIAGGRGVTMDLRGEDIALKTYKSRISGGAPGGIDINSFSLETVVELKETTLDSGADLSVRPDGMEAKLMAVDTVFNGTGVTTVSASGAAARGVLELKGSPTLVRGRRVVMQASPGSQHGVAKITQIRAEAGAAAPAGDSDLIVRTGTFGTTEVKGSSLFAARSVAISTGPQGTCKQESNQITAPIQELCP